MNIKKEIIRLTELRNNYTYGSLKYALLSEALIELKSELEKNERSIKK